LMGLDNTALFEQRATAAEQRVTELEQSNAALVQARGQQVAEMAQLAQKCADAETRALAAEKKLRELKQSNAALVQEIQADDHQLNPRVAELERQLAENQAAFTSLSQHLAQVEQRAQVREQELSAQASA
ncbi:hypothetical protein NEUTE1DRAFT_21184, partial [Neurospora tetrasperma FGSC 2508]